MKSIYKHDLPVFKDAVYLNLIARNADVKDKDVLSIDAIEDIVKVVMKTLDDNFKD